MIADFRKEKQMYDKELQSFNLRSFAIIRVSSETIISLCSPCPPWWTPSFLFRYDNPDYRRKWLSKSTSAVGI